MHKMKLTRGIIVSRHSIVITPILALAIVSTVLNFSAESSPATIIFELVTLLFCLAPPIRIAQPQLAITILATIYIFSSLIYSVALNRVDVLDFALAFKAFYYLILLSFCSRGAKIPLAKLELFLKSLIIIFAIKYSISRIALGISRPILFTENNYELIFLLIAYYAYYTRSNTLQPLWIGLIIYIFFISGSRSSIFALAFTIFFMTIRGIDRKTLLGAVLLLASAIGAYYVFYDRLAENSIDSIDRIRFFNLFLYEVRDWGLLKYLVGSERLTPLSSYTCGALSYYSSLMSYRGNGTCYSVALHSYILRAIFDHGILILIALITAVALLLSKSKYSKTQIACILGIVLITSLSVSSLNNAYVALGLTIALSAERQKSHMTL